MGCDVKIIQEDELLAGKEVGNPNASGLMWAGSISLVLGIFMMNETFAPFLITGGIMLLIFGYMTADEKTKKKWGIGESSHSSFSNDDWARENAPDTGMNNLGTSSSFYND